MAHRSVKRTVSQEPDAGSARYCRELPAKRVEDCKTIENPARKTAEDVSGNMKLQGQQVIEGLEASCESNRHLQENWLAHFPSLLRHFAEGKLTGCQNGSGVLAIHEYSDHAGCLRTGSEFEQASRAAQDCKDDGLKSRH